MHLLNITKCIKYHRTHTLYIEVGIAWKCVMICIINYCITLVRIAISRRNFPPEVTLNGIKNDFKAYYF